MAKAPDIAPRREDGQRVSASTWALVATLAGSALLLYTGVMTGEWRGVVVSELQILVVGLTTALVLRGD